MTVWRLLVLAWELTAAAVVLMVATSLAYDGLVALRTWRAARWLDDELAGLTMDQDGT